VELEPQVAGAYELFLEARGYRVTSVSSLAAALRVTSGRAPEAVVIGTLPDTVDVGTVADRIRTVAAPHPLTVVVLSPNLDEVPSADIVIPRGAHPRALLDALRTALRRRPNTQPLATVS
jgi:DNA-binding response OmpR family regulator